MKRQYTFPAIVLLLLLMFFSWPSSRLQARGEANSFIITNADATNTFGLTGSSALTALLQNTEPRFVIEYANAKRILPFTAPPTALLNHLQSAEERFVIQFANAKQVLPLVAPSTGLVALLQKVADRFVLEYANASHTIPLSYPVALIGDTIAPEIINISHVISADGVILTVETDEYTLAWLDYGLVSGAYTETLIISEYDFEHDFVVTGLQSGIPYYYQVTVTDRSGNTSQSPEGTFGTYVPLYLPIVVK